MSAIEAVAWVVLVVCAMVVSAWLLVALMRGGRAPKDGATQVVPDTSEEPVFGDDGSVEAGCATSAGEMAESDAETGEIPVSVLIDVDRVSPTIESIIENLVEFLRGNNHSSDKLQGLRASCADAGDAAALDLLDEGLQEARLKLGELNELNRRKARLEYKVTRLASALAFARFEVADLLGGDDPDHGWFCYGYRPIVRPQKPEWLSGNADDGERTESPLKNRNVNSMWWVVRRIAPWNTDPLVLDARLGALLAIEIAEHFQRKADAQQAATPADPDGPLLVRNCAIEAAIAKGRGQDALDCLVKAIARAQAESNPANSNSNSNPIPIYF